MDIEYRMDFMTGEKLSSIQVANIDITYWSVLLSSRRGWDGVRGWMSGGRGLVIFLALSFALLENNPAHTFIRTTEN